MTRTIYVVYGATGTYDDARDWPVIAFTDQDRATNYADNATMMALRLLKQYDWHSIPAGANNFDLEMQADSNGTSYSVASIELEE